MGLAKPHIIGEKPANAYPEQLIQPGQAIALIRAKMTRHLRKRGIVGPTRHIEQIGQPFPQRFLFDRDLDVGNNGGERQDLPIAETDPAGAVIYTTAVSQVIEPGQWCPVNLQPFLARKTGQFLFSGGQDIVQGDTGISKAVMARQKAPAVLFLEGVENQPVREFADTQVQEIGVDDIFRIVQRFPVGIKKGRNVIGGHRKNGIPVYLVLHKSEKRQGRCLCGRFSECPLGRDTDGRQETFTFQIIGAGELIIDQVLPGKDPFIRKTQTRLNLQVVVRIKKDPVTFLGRRAISEPLWRWNTVRGRDPMFSSSAESPSVNPGRFHCPNAVGKET